MPQLVQLTWPEAGKAIKACLVALLPVGSVEQHGPHLPLATDSMIAQAIAVRLVEDPRWLLLPSLSLGVSHEHGQFWGTLTVSAEELRGLALATIHSAAAHGITRFVLVNGHGTNCAALDDAARVLRSDGLPTYVFNWWQAIAPTLASLSLRPVDHAGPVETSLMLAIDPRHVRSDRFQEAGQTDEWGAYVDGVQVEFDAVRFSAKGNIGDPRSADAATGQVLLHDAVAALGRFCQWLADQPDARLAPPPHLP